MINKDNELNNQGNYDIDDERNKDIKLYTPGQMVNFKLTPSRSDIMGILNERKMNGVNISEYLAYIIRLFEGLPIPQGSVTFDLDVTDTEGYAKMKMAKEQVQSSSSVEVTMTDDQIDRIAQRMFSMFKDQGLVAQAPSQTVGEMPATAVDDEEAKKKKEEMKNITKNMFGFGDDDDDDDDDD